MRREKKLVSEEEKSWFRQEASDTVDRLRSEPGLSPDSSSELEFLELCRSIF